MKRLIYAVAFMAALVACTQQEPDSRGFVTTQSNCVTASAGDFEDGNGTRTTITHSGSAAPAFAWKTGDVIGIIPMNNETVQSNYKVAEIGSDPKQALFDGGVWALKEGKSYAAYYPYQKEAVISGDKLEFSFQGQTQIANNSLEHIGAYDFMYANAVVPQGESAQFNFRHLISLVRMQITVPQTDVYTSLTLESTAAWFAGKAELSLADGTMTSTQSLKNCTIALDNISVNSGSVLTVWFATLPTSALNGGSLTVKLYGQNSFCVTKLTGLNAFEAGKAYSYSCSPVLSTGVEYVDLGLSVKWATCNIGASSPVQYGSYYQWGGLQDVTSTNITINWGNCSYHTGSIYTTNWTKYVPSGKMSYWSGSGSPDNKTVLDPEDDIAQVKLGSKWRIPTETEWTELRQNCKWEWTTENGVNGYKVTSKKSGFTDKSIFLPAAGYRLNNYLNDAGYTGYYWSSSLFPDVPYYAISISCYSNEVLWDFASRSRGQSIRPVSD